MKKKKRRRHYDPNIFRQNMFWSDYGSGPDGARQPPPTAANRRQPPPLRACECDNNGISLGLAVDQKIESMLTLANEGEGTRLTVCTRKSHTCKLWIYIASVLRAAVCERLVLSLAGRRSLLLRERADEFACLCNRASINTVALRFNHVRSGFETDKLSRCHRGRIGNPNRARAHLRRKPLPLYTCRHAGRRQLIYSDIVPE
ncbi:hypothetical protein F2P81_018951 [Scophthalmus maximus]|uniref:Uncharacterized protein n=1 Tax=Scophthalmus maximus TaxID=52904 RepID=A0A6A4S3Q3_SCOMX|nr:hypothetical protein F2P81_018951 [Scophthalmus maximus]